MELDDFKVMIEQEGLNLNMLRDSRYDMVIHLQTAAKGAEDHFSLANNIAREEGIEMAINLCNKVGQAYLGHPNYKLVPNHTNFIRKLDTVANLISKLFNIKNDKYGTDDN